MILKPDKHHNLPLPTLFEAKLTAVADSPLAVIAALGPYSLTLLHSERPLLYNVNSFGLSENCFKCMHEDVRQVQGV